MFTCKTLNICEKILLLLSVYESYENLMTNL